MGLCRHRGIRESISSEVADKSMAPPVRSGKRKNSSSAGGGEPRSSEVFLSTLGSCTELGGCLSLLRFLPQPQQSFSLSLGERWDLLESAEPLRAVMMSSVMGALLSVPLTLVLVQKSDTVMGGGVGICCFISHAHSTVVW